MLPAQRNARRSRTTWAGGALKGTFDPANKQCEAEQNCTTPEGVLTGEIRVGKRYGTGECTEVDASIEGPGSIVFIESKLYSTMSAADPEKQKPHNQIERKIRVGLREASHRDSAFYFILLDVAPLESLRSLNAGVSLAEAMKANATGFGGKWTTAYWFARYKYGSRGSLAPLQKLLADAGFPQSERRMWRKGWGG